MLICVDDVVLMMAEEAAAAEAGWSKKNKNPTLQCGGKNNAEVENHIRLVLPIYYPAGIYGIFGT